MAGIGIVLNRNAGKHQAFRGKIGEKLAFVLGDRESLRETETVDEIVEVARTFRERQIDILGISGGDGSNHYTLSTFLRVYGDDPLPRVAFLCGGTHNAHAASIGVSGTPEQLLQIIMRKYHTREPFEITQRNLLRVDDGNEVRFGFSLATGFMFRFMEELHIRQRDSPLKVASLIASWFGSWIVHGKKIKTLFRLEPAKVTIAGELLPWEQINAVAASTMEKLGLGFTPFPRANETPTTFHLGVMKVRPASFAKLMWAYKRGRCPQHPEQHDVVTDDAVLETNEPISYVFDGELYRGTERLQIRTGPRLDLIVS